MAATTKSILLGLLMLLEFLEFAISPLGAAVGFGSVVYAYFILFPSQDCTMILMGLVLSLVAIAASPPQ